jgi:transcriptional regulator with XRE-family HTH domain
MADLEADYRLILKDQFQKRKSKRPRFSLRSFARFLSVDPTFLSKILSGKLLLSVDTAAKIAQRLELPEADRKSFLISAAEEQRCHALYLVDPTLTPCDPRFELQNRLPKL